MVLKMDLLVNERSVHQQFYDVEEFGKSLDKLMEMRKVARRWKRDIFCTRNMANAKPMRETPMARAVQGLEEAQRRSVMAWLNRGGPFWDDAQEHGEDDWLEVDINGEIVTDSAVGEAAYRSLMGVDTDLVSVVPSDWDFSPVSVTWRRVAQEGNESARTVQLENWRNATALGTALAAAASPMVSWRGLRETSVRKFEGLEFTDDCFGHLEGVPFKRTVADHLMKLFGILDRLVDCFDEKGVRTPEGHQIMEQYFSGSAVFSDSSRTEKQAFRDQLTFRHPRIAGESLLCGWHGKMRRDVIRFHFSWPIRADEPVYVVYVGPKLTKR